MKQVTIHAAKTYLSKLVEAALIGEEIVIAGGTKPVVRLVPIARRTFKIGMLEGPSGGGPDVFAPLPDDELDLWEAAGEVGSARHACLSTRMLGPGA